MDFSDTTNKQGLVQDTDFLVNSDSTSYPLADKARSANRALDEVVGLILSVDGRWEFDDTNYTDLPIGTTNIVSGQQDYGIDTSMIDILRVEVKDSNGSWRLLLPFDQKDLYPSNTGSLPYNAFSAPGYGLGTAYSLTDYMSTSGIPQYYNKVGNSIFLYPKPNYSSTGGLKVYFQRKANYFTSTSTNTQPGYAKHLHRYISYKMAYDYAVAKMLNTNKITSLLNEINLMKANIINFYTIRDKDERPAIYARNTPSY